MKKVAGTVSLAVLALLSTAALIPNTAQAVSFNNTSSGSSGTDDDSYTFAALSLGAAANDRLVVALSWRDTNANTLTSVTVGGVTLTKIVEARGTPTLTGPTQTIQYGPVLCRPVRLGTWY